VVGDHEPRIELITEEGDGVRAVDAEEKSAGCGADAFEGFSEG